MEKSLNNFWSYIDNFYLRKPSAEQIERLATMRALLESGIEYPCIQDSIRLTKSSHHLLTDQYLDTLTQLEFQNILKHIEISQKLFLNKEKTHWKTVDRVLRKKQEIIPKKKKNYNALLEEEKLELEDLTNDLGSTNQYQNHGINNEIEKLTKELNLLNSENKNNLKGLEEKVRQEIKKSKVIFIVNKPNPNLIIQTKISPKKPKGRPPKIPHQESSSQTNKNHSWDINDPKLRIQVQSQFIQYAYIDIQRKILAESMCRVVGMMKHRNALKFEVIFDEALQLQTLALTKAELLKLNQLKQLSLFKFYRVSGKCLYGNICQNIAGFTYIHKHLRQPNLIKNATTQEMISRCMTQPVNPASSKLFNKFEMCHNCQQLYHQTYLIDCNYRAVRPKWESGDPHAPKHKDIYTIKDGAYVCQRKYCHHCINTSYTNRKKNGLCPFCQQICYCPRCQKQSILTRLKGIYESLGGDVARLEELSIITPLKKKNNQTELLNKKAHKKQLFEIDSIQTFRDQMEECRQICQMIKRRQKQKLRLMDCKKQLFERNLDFFRDEIFFKRQLPVSENQKQIDPQKVYWDGRGKVKKIK